METTNVKYPVWPVTIDHIEVRDSQFIRNNVEVRGKTYLFYVKPDFEFGFNRPMVMTVFEGSDIANRYKDLKIEEINGTKVITAQTIEAAVAPGESEAKPYVGKDGTQYESYGEYLITLGTKNAFEPKLKTSGVVFAELPIGNGVEQFIRMKDGKPQKRQKTNQVIISATAQVAAMLMYTPYGWRGMFGSDEQSLRAEVSNQLSTGLWKQIDETIISDKPEETDDTTDDSGAE